MYLEDCNRENNEHFEEVGEQTVYPILFSIGRFEVHVWGIFVGLAVLAGLWLAVRLARGTEFSAEMLQEYAIYGVMAGFVGARLWEVIFSWSDYADNPLQALMFWQVACPSRGRWSPTCCWQYGTSNARDFPFGGFSRRQFDGQIALTYFVLYSLARLGLEFLRTDSLMIGGLKAAQVTALVTAVIAAGLWLWRMSGKAGAFRLSGRDIPPAK